MTTKKRNYINNKDLLAEVIKSKHNGKMTEDLAQMLIQLCKRYATKSNFAGYTYNDDMQAFALFMLVRTWHSFNPDKGSNPFAFYTQCIKNSFRQYLTQEKKQRDVRDELLVREGLSPSYSYQIDSENTTIDDNAQEHTNNEDRLFIFDEENQDNSGDEH